MGNGEQALDPGIGRSDDMNSDSDGWKCTQCEKVNDEADDSYFLCAADRPSDNNNMSTLLLHAVCVERAPVPAILFFLCFIVLRIKAS